jgi:photosystem II stability/assembly factor-like uncharacterized protein
MTVLYSVLFALSLLPAPQGLKEPDLKVGIWKNLTPDVVNLHATGNDLTFVQGVSLDPNNPSTIYLCVCSYNASLGGLYKSTDTGLHWNKIGKLDEPLHLEIDPKNSNNLYAVDGVRGATLGFWKSRDGGLNWEKPAGFDVTAKSVGTSDLYSLAVDPTDFKHVLVSFHSPWSTEKGAGLLETTDAGESWRVCQPAAPGVGVGSAVFFLFDPKKKIGDKKTWLLTTQAGGFFRTTDAGKTWSAVSNGQMTHGGNQIFRAADGTLYSGGYQFPSRSTDNGATWTSLSQSGLRYGWYMGFAGGDGKIFTGPMDSPVFTTAESDGSKWSTLETVEKKTFKSYPFEMRYDSKRGILYSAAWGDGLWAIKLRESPHLRK